MINVRYNLSLGCVPSTNTEEAGFVLESAAGLQENGLGVFISLFGELWCCLTSHTPYWDSSWLLTNDWWNNMKFPWINQANRYETRLHLQAEDIFSISKGFLLCWIHAACCIFQIQFISNVLHFHFDKYCQSCFSTEKTLSWQNLYTKMLSWVVNILFCQHTYLK